MTHIQLDDAFFDHPKVLSVGKDAKILSVAAICYAGNMLTDGFIPAGAVAVLAAKTGVTKSKQAVDELIAARLWEATEGGFLIHDYLDYNTSAEKVREKQAAARERMQQRRSQEVRANKERSSNEVRANFAETSDEVREPTTTTTTTTEGSFEPIGSSEPEIPSDDGTPPNPLDDNAKPQPWDLIEALCDEIGTDPSVLSKQDKGRQLAVAKRLVEGGASVQDIRDITKWLTSQNWVSAVDLQLIEKQIGKWRLNGKPAGPPKPFDPTEAFIRGELTSLEQLQAMQRARTA